MLQSELSSGFEKMGGISVAKKSLRALAASLLIFSLLGFRVFPGSWRISRNDPTVWIKLCTNQPTIETYDIPSSDPLGGLNPTYQQIVQSVIDDYNAVQTSYFRFALYPTNPSSPGIPLPGDSTFTLAKGNVRTIEVCFDGTSTNSGLSSGHAQPTYADNGDIVGCEIKGRPDSTKKASQLIQLLTHELGHCVGLDHNQPSINSVMSYFISPDLIRLANDDKSGITYLYPKDPSYANEEVTLGLAGCSPKN
jgi:hypothetical protein